MQRYFESVFCNISKWCHFCRRFMFKPSAILYTCAIDSLDTMAHFLMTSSMETFSALLALCVGNSPVIGEFPSQRPVTRGFDGFFDLRLNRRSSNNRESGDLRRHRAHYNVNVMKTRLVYGVTMTNAGYRLGNWFTKDKPYPPLTGEIFNVLENSYLDTKRLDCTREIVPWNSCVFASNDLQYLLIG